jgi:hypothetical protein
VDTTKGYDKPRNKEWNTLEVRYVVKDTLRHEVPCDFDKHCHRISSPQKLALCHTSFRSGEVR